MLFALTNTFKLFLLHKHITHKFKRKNFLFSLQTIRLQATFSRRKAAYALAIQYVRELHACCGQNT